MKLDPWEQNSVNYTSKTQIMFLENISEKVVCKMVPIFHQPQCFNTLMVSDGYLVYVPENQAITDTENGLSPVQHQAIIWNNAGSLSTASLKTYFRSILIKMQQFSIKFMHLKMLFVKCLPFYLGLGRLNISSGQNGCHYTDNIFKCSFMNEKFCISI